MIAHTNWIKQRGSSKQVPTNNSQQFHTYICTYIHTYIQGTYIGTYIHTVDGNSNNFIFSLSLLYYLYSTLKNN